MQNVDLKTALYRNKDPNVQPVTPNKYKRLTKMREDEVARIIAQAIDEKGLSFVAVSNRIGEGIPFVRKYYDLWHKKYKKS